MGPSEQHTSRSTSKGGTAKAPTNPPRATTRRPSLATQLHSRRHRTTNQECTTRQTKHATTMLDDTIWTRRDRGGIQLERIQMKLRVQTRLAESSMVCEI